jgi:hypothetical protein
VKKEEMDYLAATRPLPVPLSPQCAHQQFECVLGLGAGTPPPPFMMKADSQSSGASDARPTTMPSPPQTPRCTETLLEHTHQRTCQLHLERHLPVYAEVEDLEACEAPRLYAVRAGSNNRVFNDQ